MKDELREIIESLMSGPPADVKKSKKLATDAWNYFPHKSLDGKSPMEMY